MLPDQREARMCKVLEKWCIFFNWNFEVFLCLPKESIEIAVDWFSCFQKGGQKIDGASSSPTCLSRRMKNESPAPSPISLEEKQNQDVRYKEEKQHTWLRALCCCCTSLLMSSFGRKRTWAWWTEKKAWQKSWERKMQMRWDWKTYSSTEEEELSCQRENVSEMDRTGEQNYYIHAEANSSWCVDEELCELVKPVILAFISNAYENPNTHMQQHHPSSSSSSSPFKLC